MNLVHGDGARPQPPQDVLAQLGEQGRRLMVARKLPDGKLDMDTIREVIEDFKSFKKRERLSLRAIAKRMGKDYSPSVLSIVLRTSETRQYIGDTERVVRGLNQLMEQVARTRTTPTPSGFVETEVARRILTLVRNAVSTRTIGLVTGPAGVGKTMTVQAAASQYPGAIYVRVLTTTRSASTLSRRIADALRIDGVRGGYALQQKIIEALQDSDRLLMIDEAHQLNADALEFIRDLHDECTIPVILVGTRKISDKCADTEVFFGQFNRRISIRFAIEDDVLRPVKPKPLFTPQEILKVFAIDQVRLTDDGAITLCNLANVMGLGSLGLCRQVVIIAAQMVKSQNRAIDTKVIMAVINQLHGRQVAEMINHRIDNLQVKVG